MPWWGRYLLTLAVLLVGLVVSVALELTYAFAGPIASLCSALLVIVLVGYPPVSFVKRHWWDME